MPIVTAVVLSTFLLVVTGCATSGPPPATKQETGKKGSTRKAIKHDQERSMNEQSLDAVR
jgi:Flp pilus assembly protein TadD